MRAALTKLARHSLIYGIGSGLGIAGSFLLIPLYTHALTTAEYGALELLYRTSDILMLIMFMGVRQAYIRFYFDKRDDDEWHRTVTGTTIFFVLLSCFVATLLFLPFLGPIKSEVLRDSVGNVVFFLVLAWIPFEMLLNVGLTYFQIRTQSIAYVGINLARLMAFIGLNLLFVYHLHYGVGGVFLAQISVVAALAIAVLVYLVRLRRLKISVPLIWEMVRYGLPYLPAAFFMYLISNSDRYFLGIFGTLDAVGIYALAVKVGMVGVMFLMDPFLKVWSPFLFEHYQQPGGPALISRAFTLFTLASVATALAIAVMVPVVLPYITGRDFYAAFNLVPLISLGAVFYSMAHLVDAGILISKKTKYKPLIYGIAAGVSLLANVTLIKPLGVWGATIASALSFLTLLLVNHYISNRFYRLPLEWGRLFLIFVAAILTYGISVYILKRDSASLLAQGESLLVTICFPLILWAGGFFTRGEREALQSLFRFPRRKVAE